MFLDRTGGVLQAIKIHPLSKSCCLFKLRKTEMSCPLLAIPGTRFKKASLRNDCMSAY